jgi:glycerol-3-phosphate dehydrogenase (NAD(P)+)
MKQQISVLGDGAFGTAIALVLADNGYTVALWCHNAAVADSIRTTGCNTLYLPGIQLPESIVPTTDIAQALAESCWVFEAVPVKFLRAVVEKAKPYSTREHTWIVLSKGIETDTLMLPSALIDTVLGYHATQAIISGPSFARDLAQKKITAVTVATQEQSVMVELQTLLANNYFTLCPSADMRGVQIGGALKNVVALAIGMLDGAGYTDNTKAFILNQGLQEIAYVVEALGGTQQTVYNLSGLGDLVLTCMGSLSKNCALGRQLGSGKTLVELAAGGTQMPEGVTTAVAVQQLAQKLGLELPLLQGVYRILFEQSSLEMLLKNIVVNNRVILQRKGNR